MEIISKRAIGKKNFRLIALGTTYIIIKLGSNRNNQTK